MLALSIPIGLIVGLSLGALGGGGSILTVPALVYLLGQDTHAATTGSLIIVGITAVAGMTAHHREGRVRVAEGMVFGVLGIGGAYVGSLLSASVAPAVLMSAFSLLMLVVAALMLARARRGRGSAPAADLGVVEEPILTFRPSFVCACPRALKVLVTASGVGLLTGFFGVGGGFVVVPALVLALGFTMPVAVGTSLLVIAINSGTSLVARAGGGIDIDWTVVGVFTAAAVIGSLLGARIATRARPEALRIAFAVLIIAVGLYTAARSIPALFG